MQLRGKVALITGAGRGIGRATAVRFVEEGARVAVADLKLDTSRQVASELDSLCESHCALPLEIDVTDSASVEQAVRATVAWGGRIDVLVNNAGITKDNRVQNMSEEDWDAVIDVNLKGSWLCAKVAAPYMVEQGSGSIINVSSIVGLYGNFGQSNYAATKAGVIGLTKSLARELGPKGVRVNCVTPGFTATEMLATVPEKLIAGIEERTPLRRLAQPEEIANAYVFLASDLASYVNGAVLPVDGGLTI